LAAATPSKWDEEKREEIVAEFGDLAQAAKGAKWLGVLRMDVDSLGSIFRSRLGNKATIARMSTLSESLRLFFESRVPQICRESNLFSPSNRKEQDKLFLLYAGGDDLFVAGAWSELPELAQKIRDDFRQFVGGDHITLSAGIAIEHEKYPLYQLANEAKHALDDRAKEYEHNGSKKDAICFLQTAVAWDDFYKIQECQQKLVKMIEVSNNNKPPLPKGFLTRLSQIHSLFAENRKSALRLEYKRRHNVSDSQDLQDMIYYNKWCWQLVYHLGRFAERYKDHAEMINDLQKQIIELKLIDHLNVIARWAELLTRKE
jgi:CRISPR-associated protein Csm1